MSWQYTESKIPEIKKESRKDGEPAFPKVFTCDSFYEGMSLRDYFAAKAMQGLIASNDVGAGDRLVDIPTYAYEIADAMLEAREK